MNANNEDTIKQVQQKEKKPHKVVINKDYGGFRLSEEAIAFLEKQPEIMALKKEIPEFDANEYFWQDHRDNPALVRCVESLGERASEEYASLVVEKIHSDKYFICEYDGAESVISRDIEELYDSHAYLMGVSNILGVPQQAGNVQEETKPQEPEQSDKLEKLYLTKLSVLNNAVNNGTKSRAYALSELNDMASRRVPTIILAAVVMRAEDFAILPKQDREVTHPFLVPLADCVISSAIENPNRNQTLLDVSQSAINHLMDCAPEDRFDEIAQRLAPRQQYISQAMSQLPPIRQPQNISYEESNIVCSTKYMGARGADLVKDEDGVIRFVSKNEPKKQEKSNKATLDLSKLNLKGKDGY